MRTYKNLFKLKTIKPIIEDYTIGYTKIYIYNNIDEDEDIYFSQRIRLLFKLCLYDKYILFWFKNYDEFYQDLEEYLELTSELYLKIIIIID